MVASGPKAGAFGPGFTVSYDTANYDRAALNMGSMAVAPVWPITRPTSSPALNITSVDRLLTPSSPTIGAPLNLSQSTFITVTTWYAELPSMSARTVRPCARQVPHQEV